MRDLTLVLLGCHGVGKTSVGTELARILRIPFHVEIGRCLADDGEHRPQGVMPADPQEAFDRSVFSAELERDAAWNGRGPRIVETWHPGNLAYAEQRSPAIVAAFWPAVLQACGRIRAIGIPMRAPPETLLARRSEPGDIRFFVEVASRAEEWARRLAIDLLQPVDTHRVGPQEIAVRLARVVRGELARCACEPLKAVEEAG